MDLHVAMDEEMAEEDKHLSNDLKSLQMVLSQNAFSTFYESVYEPDTEPTKTREHLVNLINLNREYQDVLKMCVKQTEAALLRNTELQKKIRLFSQSNKNRRAPKKNQGATFFYDSSTDSTPVWNIDTRDKLDQERKVPTHFKFRKWTKNEKEALSSAIVQFNKKLLYQQYLEAYSINHADKSIAEIAKLANEQVNLLPIDHFYNPKDIDWDYISKSDGLSNRSSVDCKLRWINSDHPGINNSSWNKTEDKNLLALVKKYKNQDWESIADELGTHNSFSMF